MGGICNVTRLITLVGEVPCYFMSLVPFRFEQMYHDNNFNCSFGDHEICPTGRSHKIQSRSSNVTSRLNKGKNLSVLQMLLCVLREIRAQLSSLWAEQAYVYWFTASQLDIYSAKCDSTFIFSIMSLEGRDEHYG